MVSDKMVNIPILTDKEMENLGKSLQKLVQKKRRRTQLPFVTLKFAQTLDGKIATANGDSKWISGPISLSLVHRLRSFHDAVLVGVDTIIQDDPQLDVRLVKGKNPYKIIVDSRLRTPLNSNILKGRAALSTIIATTALSSPKRIRLFRSKGAEVWILRRDSSNQVDMSNLIFELGRKGIRSILVEGGTKIIQSFLKKRLVDHIFIFIAPKIIGNGMTALNIPSSPKFLSPDRISSYKLFQSGDDILLSMPVQN